MAAICCVAVLLAFVLRVSGLGTQSLWYDEGFSVYLSRQSIPDLISLTAQDIHPPLYYLLLFAWKALTGESEFALRFLSLVFSVGSVAAIARLAGRASKSAPAMVAAAFIAAIAPVNVWYGQETRMYSLLGLLTALSLKRLLALTDLAQSAQPMKLRTLAGWAAVNVLLAYTHSFGLFAIAAEAVALFVWWLLKPGSRKTMPALLASLLLVGLAYLPWVFPTLGRLNQDESFLSGTLDPSVVVSQMREHLVAGPTLEGPAVQLAVAASQILVLAGLVALRRRFPASILLVSAMLIPIVLLLAVSWNRPKYQPRYLFETVPALQAMMGIGAGVLWEQVKRLRASERKLLPVVSSGVLGLLTLGLSAAWIPGLDNMYWNAKFARDDWRGAVADLSLAPGDAVLLVSGHAFPVFEYYFGNRQFTPLPEGRTLSVRNTLGFDVADKLNGLRGAASRFWVVRWQDDVVDPNGFLRRVLETGADKAKIELAPHGIGIERYDSRPGVSFSREPNIENPVHVDFDQTLELLGFETSGSAETRAGSVHLPAGEKGRLTLFWKGVKQLSADYKVFVRLVDDSGNEWGRVDQRPANYQFLTSRWKPGETVFGAVDIPTTAATPPGKYRLSIGVYAEDGAAIDTLDVRNTLGAKTGQSAQLTDLTLDSPRSPQPAVTPPRSVNQPLGTLTLIGAGQAEDLGQVRPGETIPLSLYWSRGTGAPRDQLEFRLDGGSNGIAVEQNVDAVSGWPAANWPDNTVWQGFYQLRLPGTARPGDYVLRISNGASSPFAIGRLSVDPVDRQTELPAVAYPSNVPAGDFARFRGYNVDETNSRPGGSVKYTLYWVAERESRTGLTGFVHLLNDARQVVAQRDSVPGEGILPTTGWVSGQVIADTYSIAIPANVTSGDYRVEIGLYDPLTGKRAALDGAEQLELRRLTIR